MMENIITKEHEIVIITQALCLLFTGYFFTLQSLFHPHKAEIYLGYQIQSLHKGTTR